MHVLQVYFATEITAPYNYFTSHYVSRSISNQNKVEVNYG